MIKKTTLTTASACSEIMVQANREFSTMRIFEIFQRIAANPLSEIGGRMVWSQRKGDLSGANDFYLVELTRCTTTVQALLTSLFGPETSCNAMRVFHLSEVAKQPIAAGYIQPLHAEILKNGELLKKESSSFHAYIFGLYRNPKPSNPHVSNHVFLMIQYADDVGKLCYRLFQSFLEQFDLKADFDKGSNFFSELQFQTFLNQFEGLCISDTWTKEREEFYKQYFHVESTLEIGDKNPYFGSTPLILGKQFTLSEVEENERKFADLKQTAIFQRAMSKVIQ